MPVFVWLPQRSLGSVTDVLMKFCTHRQSDIRRHLPLLRGWPIHIFFCITSLPGNVLQPGAGALGTRIAMLLGGLPSSVPVQVVNRQCSSGLQAVANVAGTFQGDGKAERMAARLGWSTALSAVWCVPIQHQSAADLSTSASAAASSRCPTLI